MTSVKIKEIDKNDDKLIAKMGEIYEEAFRVDERVPWEMMEYDFKRKIRKEALIHLTGAYKGNVLVGFGISLFYWDFTYPSYLAIHKSYRNQGIGTQILLKIKDLAFQDAKKSKKTPLILFEVESPEAARDSEELDQIHKRLKFYQKFNAQFLDVKYIQPPLLGDPVPMYLVIVSPPEIKYIEAKALIEYMKLIFKHEYFLPFKKQEPYLKPILESIGNRDKIYGISGL